MSMTALRWAPTAIAITGTWATIAAAQGKATGDYATWSSTTSGASAAMECRGYAAQTLIPSTATITQVRATIRYATNSTTSLSGVVARFYNGTTALGVNTTITRTANQIAETTITLSNPTYAQLADLRVRITGTRPASTISSVLYVDRIGIEIDYSVANWDTITGRYTVFGDAPTGTPATTATNPDFCLGTQFEVASANKYLTAIRFWRPPDAAIVSPLIEGGLFAVATGAEVARVAFGEVAGEIAGGWVTRFLPTPVALSPGDQYVVCCYFPGGTPITSLTWTDKVDGPVRAAAGPNARYAASTSLVLPSTLGIEQSYWVDPIVDDLSTGPEPGRNLLMAA